MVLALVAVAVKMAVPPFWTDMPKIVAIDGGPPIPACPFAAKNATKMIQKTMTCNGRLMNFCAIVQK